MKDSATIIYLLKEITHKSFAECLLLQRQLVANWDTLKQTVEKELDDGNRK